MFRKTKRALMHRQIMAHRQAMARRIAAPRLAPPPGVMEEFGTIGVVAAMIGAIAFFVAALSQ